MFNMVYSPSGCSHLAVTDIEGNVVGTACRTTKLPKNARISMNATATQPSCHRCNGMRSVIR
jgi:hypothetical protein